MGRLKILSAGLFILSLFFNSCSNEFNPIAIIDKIDPRLVGEWYYADTVNFNHPAPNISIGGFQLTEEGKYSYLAVEISTGKIVKAAADDNSIVYANEGIFIKWINLISGGPYIDSSFYSIEGNSLLIYNKYFSKKYLRTKLNSVVTIPLNSALSAMIDSVLFENSSIHHYTSSYESKISERSLIITGHNDHFSIKISLKNFSGIDSYAIGSNTSNEAYLFEIKGDAVALYPADSSETNIIQIEEYNAAEQRITGKFQFYAGFPDWGPLIEIIDGVFDLLVYE